MNSHHHYTGLTATEVTTSRALHGCNVLTPPEGTPLWRRFLEKFKDPLIVILLIAGVLSVGISFYERYGLGQGMEVFFEPVGIFVAIFLATGLAFYFEAKADKEFAILNKVNDDEPVEVVRDGNTTQVARRDIVVGDIVSVVAGCEVPADGELLEAIHLSVDESTLTGEPICHKTADATQLDPKATYPSNCLLRGTKVMEGHGLMRITAVGDATENGKVYKAVQIDNSVKTPLSEQLDRLGARVSYISYTVAALVVVGRIVMFLAQGGFDFTSINLFAFIAYVLQTFMVAVTLIVVAVPEGLPMAVTLSLAYSMRRMLKTNNLVRRMHACETMGCATVICTDKTGTLTENRMTVDELLTFGSAPSGVLKEGIAVNTTASLDLSDAASPQPIGNPTEGALLLWLHSHGIDYQAMREAAEVVAEVPFSTERKYMAMVVKSNVMKGQCVAYVKGAPEIVLAMMDDKTIDNKAIEERLATFQSHAMRTLAFGYVVLGDNVAAESLTPERLCDALSCGESHLIGLAAIADPVRKEVPDAIRECLAAGIDVKIVTGDTIGTAKEIGRQVGLWTDSDTDDNAISGPELAALSDDELTKRANLFKIIYRARPMDKKRLVEALQRGGEVVAVTGDGTNDAPALKVAHVGLSMGDGTAVAKEASDITIIDNSFRSICMAVMWGRSLYQNIQRFLLFQLTVNVTACLLVLSGSFMGTESPLTVTQMLWINLIMDTFAAMALASLPPSAKVMKDAPRNRHDFIINREMTGEIVGVGCFFYLLLVAMLYVFEHADVRSLTDILTIKLGAHGEMTGYELTLLFTTFVMTHFFYLFNARAFHTGRSALHLKGCDGLVFIVVLIFVVQVMMVELPGVQRFFNVESLKLDDWLIIVAGSSLVLWVREAWNALRKKA